MLLEHDFALLAHPSQTWKLWKPQARRWP